MSSSRPNRLIHEKSPYLLQHAHNPVDWYPWGTDAFETAKREDKPLLVSIGYSTCHWCHVMERESFEDEGSARLMNEYLVAIKVDREERPDIDKIYMTAISAMTGQGGWPLNVFLTPDLKPFFGGTYFPPEARRGHPAWKDIVRHIGTSWKVPTDREKMLAVAGDITNSLQKVVEASPSPARLDPIWLSGGFEALRSSFDGSRGGFGQAPKFPMPVYHQFLMRYWARTNQEEALEMSLSTLRAMARGGIYDQLGGGFARYATDPRWNIPHFEKMLYDNAQLIVNYLEAFQITADNEFRRIARQSLDYIARDMTSPEGAFFSAEDADSSPSGQASEMSEGAFYVWEKKEIVEVLGAPAAEVFCFRYGVRDQGTAPHDPHGEFVNQNILSIAHSLTEVAQHFKLELLEVEKALDSARAALFQARQKRPRPQRDDKVIAAWNGLMITACAKAYQILGHEHDLRAAQKAARFVMTHLFDDQKKRLYRCWREGEKKSFGIAEDYAFMIQAFLDLYEADFDPTWIVWADKLNQVMIRQFYDHDHGGFFMTSQDQDPHLLWRFKADEDQVEPSASSVGALNLLRLAQFLDEASYREMSVKTIESYGHRLAESPSALTGMLAAVDFATTDPRQIVLAGEPGAQDTRALFSVLYSRYWPVKVVLGALGGPKQRVLSKRLPFLDNMTALQGKATAYVCENFTCRTPTPDPQEFDRQLSKTLASHPP